MKEKPLLPLFSFHTLIIFYIILINVTLGCSLQHAHTHTHTHCVSSIVLHRDIKISIRYDSMSQWTQTHISLPRRAARNVAEADSWTILSGLSTVCTHKHTLLQHWCSQLFRESGQQDRLVSFRSSVWRWASLERLRQTLVFFSPVILLLSAADNLKPRDGKLLEGRKEGKVEIK